MIKHTVELYLLKKSFTPSVNITQADTGHQIECTFPDFILPLGTTAKVWAIKPSGKIVYNDCAVSENSVIINVTNQMAAEKGVTLAQIKLDNNGELVSSFPIHIKCSMDISGNGTESKNEITILDKFLEEQGKKLDAVIEEKTADITQNKMDVEKLKNDTKKLKEETTALNKDISNKITKFYASNQGETHITDSDNGKIQDMMLYGKSSQDGTPTPENPVEIKSVVNPTVKVCGKNFYPGSDLIRLTKAYVTDFIPVILHKGKICISFDAFSDTSNGNYLINVEYFDANKESVGLNGKADLVGNNISHINFNFNESTAGYNNEALDFKNVLYVKVKFYIYANTATEITYKNIMISATDYNFEPYKPVQTVTLPYALNAIPVSSGGNITIDGQQYIADYVDVERGKLVKMVDSSKLDNTQSIVDKTEWLLAEPQETDLTKEEITAFKALVTHYPTTNISVNSEQLDGLTVFNYPISLANGWNYVKQQLNDNRDYIYDMDLQSAEAYVNSEYAVALTELEV